MKSNIFDIRDFGAIGDNKTLNTVAIQLAIDECHKNGGGRVLIENGEYVSGTLHLKSFVELYIDRNAVLVGSKEIDGVQLHYPKVFEDLIDELGV